MKTIILDHDIGTNPDDFFSLLILLNSKDIHLPLVISGNNHPVERALFAHKIIKNHGRKNIDIVSGEKTGFIEFFAYEYIKDYKVEISNDYSNAIKKVLDTHSEVIYVCIQGVSNIATFLKRFPEYQDRFEIIHMGLTLTAAENYIKGGTNMEADLPNTKYLYELGLKKMKVVGSHTTINDAIRVGPDTEIYKKLEKSVLENHRMLFTHLQEFHKRRNIWPALHDPLTVSVALGCDFVNFEKYLVDFREDGQYRLGKTVEVINSKVDIGAREFMDFCYQMI